MIAGPFDKCMLLGWLRAFLVGGWQLARYADWKITVSRLSHFLRLLASRRNYELGVRRLVICSKCEMFNHDWKTCGYIGEFKWDTDLRQVTPLGCWCFMPVAACAQKKDCWLREMGVNKGWPDELRPEKI